MAVHTGRSARVSVVGRAVSKLRTDDPLVRSADVSDIVRYCAWWANALSYGPDVLVCPVCERAECLLWRSRLVITRRTVTPSFSGTKVTSTITPHVPEETDALQEED